jgi:ArsR family transcriptional regulator
MNMKNAAIDEMLSRILRAISTTARIRILFAIGTGEACVCHLEAVLGLRQAYISQQLMEMRDAGLLETRRDGRYIFYRLAEPSLQTYLVKIGEMFGGGSAEMEDLLNSGPLTSCCCPDCASKMTPLSSSQATNLIKKLEKKDAEN